MASSPKKSGKKAVYVNLEDVLKPTNGDFEQLVTYEGKEVELSSLKGLTVGIYFSAHWCPPCKAFTPELVEVYNAINKEKKQFEIVFVSGDRGQEEFTDYFLTMNWLAIPYKDAKRRQVLAGKFDVQGIPAFVVIGPDGEILTKAGVRGIEESGVAGFPWAGYTDSSCIIL
jgi:nucleoredoxin